MRTSPASLNGIKNFGGMTQLAVGLLLGLLTSCVVDDPSLTPVASQGLPAADDRAAIDAAFEQLPQEPVGDVCTGGRFRCFAHIRKTSTNRIHGYATPNGLGAADLAAAYGIDPTLPATATIAIVDAYGYPNLESDLAAYRSQYGLPPCTVANGCLVIRNQSGQASPLPPPPPAGDDWTIETALDVDMASAACPSCKLLVVQADDDQGNGLFIANNAAVTLGATVVSNSWGGPEQPGVSLAATEAYFNHPGVAIFASSGDNGYNDGGQGPDYPATSQHTIAVGGTTLVRTAGGRGFTERAWSLGGSACSLSIPKPGYQTGSPCANRASADVAAVGDPATGLAIYNAGAGGWGVVGGTSAASPLVAGMFAATGHGHETAQFAYINAAKFYDVSTGANGGCGTILCNAGAGWDGPTGVGTPNFTALQPGGGSGPGPSVAITAPADGAQVAPGFAITANSGATTVRLEVTIDGTVVSTLTAAPFTYTAPMTLTAGAHTVELVAYDAAGSATHTPKVTVNLASGGGAPDANPGEITGGCATGRADGGIVLGLLLGLAGFARRRR